MPIQTMAGQAIAASFSSMKPGVARTRIVRSNAVVTLRSICVSLSVSVQSVCSGLRAMTTMAARLQPASSSMLKEPSGYSPPAGCSSAHVRYLWLSRPSGLTASLAQSPSSTETLRHGSIAASQQGVKIWPEPNTATGSASPSSAVSGRAFCTFFSSTIPAAAALRAVRAASSIRGVYSMVRSPISTSNCKYHIIFAAG